MSDSLRHGELGSARRKHCFVYCCVIARTCFEVTVLARRKYAIILRPLLDPLIFLLNSEFSTRILCAFFCTSVRSACCTHRKIFYYFVVTNVFLQIHSHYLWSQVILYLVNYSTPPKDFKRNVEISMKSRSVLHKMFPQLIPSRKVRYNRFGLGKMLYFMNMNLN
jgi:hypothetical protein